MPLSLSRLTSRTYMLAVASGLLAGVVMLAGPAISESQAGNFRMGFERDYKASILGKSVTVASTDQWMTGTYGSQGIGVGNATCQIRLFGFDFMTGGASDAVAPGAKVLTCRPDMGNKNKMLKFVATIAGSKAAYWGVRALEYLCNYAVRAAGGTKNACSIDKALESVRLQYRVIPRGANRTPTCTRTFSWINPKYDGDENKREFDPARTISCFQITG